MNAADRYDSLLQFYGEKSNIDWRLLKAQVHIESDFNPDAHSKRGAQGLAQFIQRTWKEWGDGTAGIQGPPDNILLDPCDPEDAIRAQAAYMAWLLKQLGGSEAHALAAYNWGIGRVKRILSDPHWMTRLPLETLIYVGRVEAHKRKFSLA